LANQPNFYAEAAMLAGLPKAPSAFNPVVNPKRATRQMYVLWRMSELNTSLHSNCKPRSKNG
jgi:membrane carboxypeptidase/penicillin-binding protein